MKYWDEFERCAKAADAMAAVIAERDRAVRALHECYALTGEEAGDIDDFRALVDREKHTVAAVKQLRKIAIEAITE
jgi:hypothetical protein